MEGRFEMNTTTMRVLFVEPGRNRCSNKEKVPPLLRQDFVVEMRGVAASPFFLLDDYTDSRNSRHRRHGLKTLHRSVFLTAFRSPSSFSIQKKHTRSNDHVCFLVEMRGIEPLTS